MKNLFYVFLAIIALQACRRDNTDDALTKDNKVVAEQLFAAYNTHDWDSVATFYADTCAFMTAQSNNVFFHKSKSVLINEYKTSQQNIPNIHAEMHGLYNDRNKTIIEYTLLGNTDSNTYLQHYCLIWTLKNRKITREAIYMLQ